MIYIYHNVIDAIGDKAATERDVFEAVEKTFNDLNELIKALTNNVSAINIYITSDHGFIYSRSALHEYDKVTKVDVKPIDDGRRFMLSKEKVNEHGILSLPMNYILGNTTNLNAIVPKGVIRFKVQGAGANFVHGGASLQELIVPVIKFKYIRKDEYKSTKVEVKLTNISRKITNRITFLEFFQSEKVDEKKMNLRLKLYFEDGEGNRISNENIIIADSRSSKPEDRTYREKFTLKDLVFDKTKRYYLILEDEDETVEKIYEKIPFDAVDKYYNLGNNLNQRDVIAVRKSVSGLVKLIYPNGDYDKEDIKEILEYALIGRRRVKEQLKKIGGMEFYDVHFSYIDRTYRE